MTLQIQPAFIDDAGEILALQKMAYQSEGNIYEDYTIPPLTQTLEEIQAEFGQSTFLKATQEGALVGSVRAYWDAGTCFIGRLIVHPDAQNQGIGSRLMVAIEKEFLQARRFELFTGHLSWRNLYLYQKLGYSTFKTVPVSEHLELIFLEKPNPSYSDFPL